MDAKDAMDAKDVERNKKTEVDWLFEYVCSVMKSPAWDAEVMGFIDENCMVFDNEEENKFEHTTIHEQFIEVVDGILTSHLNDISITPEAFAAACEQARFASRHNKEIFGQLMALTDFLAFKKLMVKRNMELEMLAVKELQEAAIPIVAPSDEDEAERLYQMALKESAEMSVAEAKALLDDAKKEMEDRQANSKTGEDDDDGAAEEGTIQHDIELKKAMDLNLMELELQNRQFEMEQQELEQAIAQSLAVEQERLRLALEAEAMAFEDDEDGDGDEDDEEEEEEAEYGAGISGHGSPPIKAEDKGVARTAPVPGMALSPSMRSAAKGDDADGEVYENGGSGADAKGAAPSTPPQAKGEGGRILADAMASLDTENGARGEVVAEEPVLLLANAAANPPASSGAPPADTAPASARRAAAEEPSPASMSSSPPGRAASAAAAAGTAAEEDYRPVKKDKKKKKSKRKDKERGERGPGPSTLGPLGPLSGGGKGLAPLPSLSELQEQMNRRRAEADAAFKRNQEALTAQRQAEKQLTEAAGVTPEDAARRAAHLKAQRDAILAKKRAERESKAKKYSEEKEQTLAARLKESQADQGPPQPDSPPDAKADVDVAEEQRQMMRVALARQMKRDLLLDESDRLRRLQEEQYSELDKQLRLVEALREENQVRERILGEAIRRQQEQRFRNLQQSVAKDVARGET